MKINEINNKRYYMAVFGKNCKVISQTIMHGTRQNCKDRANKTSEELNWTNKVLPAKRVSGFDRFSLDLTPQP